MTEIESLYLEYERRQLMRRKLCKIAYKLDNPRKPVKRGNLLLVILVLLFMAACAKPLCSSYTGQGVYHWNSGIVKIYPQNRIR